MRGEEYVVDSAIPAIQTLTVICRANARTQNPLARPIQRKMTSLRLGSEVSTSAIVEAARLAKDTIWRIV